MAKKTNFIKTKYYQEDIEEYGEDDYYEDDNEITKEIIKDSQNIFQNVQEEIDEEYSENAGKTFRRITSQKIMHIYNKIFILIIIIILIIGVDVICVNKYNIGPFFAINTKQYKDGGTKEYYGLGYKVIKYNEENGRKDTQIGFWDLSYSNEPLKIADIDLAIEFQNHPEETANKYYKKYIIITSNVKRIDSKNNKMILEYNDPDGKYTLEINCNMASQEESLVEYKKNHKVSIKGIVTQFAIKETLKTNRVTLNNCFIE